jgi:ubiquinol-cytochrome c reductase cytochrome b subunit
VHEPLSNDATWHLAADDRQKPIELGPLVDDNGVPAPTRRKDRLRARMSHWYFGDVVQKPTKDELQSEHHHAEAETAAKRDELTGSPD